MLEIPRLCTALIVLSAMCGRPDIVAAGGSGDEHDNHDGPLFFGYVRDTRGVGIADARVSVTYKNMSFVARTDLLGAFRIATTTDPDQSDLTCSKEGYRQAAALRRTPPGGNPNTPVEFDCTLQRAATR
jgi:hypothetical protein